MLLNRLSPDHITIAEFSTVNAMAFKAVCRAFVRFCAEARLIRGQWVAIDGSKFQAVKRRRRVLTEKKLKEQLKAINGQVQSYLDRLDRADEAETSAKRTDKQAVRAALAKLRERRADVASTAAVLEALGEKQHVVGEADAKLMKTGEAPRRSLARIFHE